ncbi:MAG: NEL domain-containing protein [Paucimonas sp.]|jgi:hypothetical protein|nr:NEL domain-containing protein [Paucimonas sp.]
MAELQDAAVTDIHYQTVSQRVPPWLLSATPAQRQALRAQPPQPMPWLAQAGARLPQVLAALREEQQRHQFHSTLVEGFLKQLPSAEAFAEPLLREAIKNTFGLDLDVRHTYLFNAAQARIDASHFTANDPLVKAFQVVKAATQPLLLAALQNFEAFEAETDGLRDGRRASTLFTSDNGLLLEAGKEVDVTAERFAALCRQLDLGEQYQRQIDSVFQPPPANDESAEVAVTNRQAFFKLHEQSTFRLNLHLARLQGWVDEAFYTDLLEVAKNIKGGAGLQRQVLKLWDVELNGLLLFTRPQQDENATQPVVVYMPDEPRQPFQAFASSQAFHASLRERLKDREWRNYFLRFVPARQRDGLLRRIQRTLYPQVWNPAGWYEAQYDGNAVLHLATENITAPLFNILLQRKIAVLKDDGLFHAVPTAEQNHKSAQDKVAYFLGIAFNVANVATFVVPGLGEVMLAVNAGLLGYEVYEGFDALSRGEREEAWGYFMDVGENLAMIAALGAVGVAAQRFTGNLPLAVRGMRPVTLGDGSVRLWKPDLTPFAWDVRLPADLQPGENGLYNHEGRQWLKLEGQYYSVRTLLGEEQGYRLEHPGRPGAYEPSVRHNGNGGWLHEADTPEQWQGLELFRRQGPLEASVSAPMAERALRISGISEAQLRQTLVDCRRPPALLTDTLRRLELAGRLETAGALDAAAFERDYTRLQPALAAEGQRLRHQFDLPNGLVNEIIEAATAEERAELLGAGGVPLRLAEEARLYRQQLRIARACEGFYLDIATHADSARLMLHALESLPGWPASLRLALYEGSLDGRLLAAIGPEREPAVALIWRGQRPEAFTHALFEAIPGSSRTQLGLDDGAMLRARLQEQPLAPRRHLREWLGMQPLKPAFRSPMRLADGRIGHPLSGRGGNPFFTEDQLLDKLRLLELEDIEVEDALQSLYSSGLDRMAINARLDGLLEEMLELRQSLDRWALESSRETLDAARQLSRERIGLALWEYWRRSILPELGQPASRLIFWQVQLADLPEDLPNFFRQRVKALLLNEVVQRIGAPHERFIGGNEVRALAARFPNLASLDIRGGQWGANLPQRIAEAWPRLTALGLCELDNMIGHPDLRALATLPRLRWLDLRGLRLRDMPVSVLNGLTLDYLGLDWLGLQAWPQWLDNAALARIGELSMIGNQLSEVPPDILNNSEAVARPLRISLQGNRFSRQALLNLRLAERFLRRFSFDLSLSPAIDTELNQRVQERRQLQVALREWMDSAPPGNPLTPAQAAYRRGISTQLLKHWRENLYSGGSSLLALESIVLSEFPGNLPVFYRNALRRLELTAFNGDVQALGRFVEMFPQLTELALSDGLTPLQAVPEFLVSFNHLRELALVRMGLTIDQAAMETFGRMPMLSSLQLDGNRLGEITDMTMFSQRFLGYLGLAEMQISTWPAWLDEMLPVGIERLGLDGNQLTTLPARLLDNRRTAEGAVEISLRGNPLSRDTQVQAHVSQHYNRPFTFIMDLPADIASMEGEAHVSDSEDDWSEQEESAQSEEDFTTVWKTGDVGEDERHEDLWRRLVEHGDCESLLKLVARLRHSADYRSGNTRPELVQRVWSLLSAVVDDADLRQTLNGMAEEPLQQLDHHETCPDGIRLEFNQMELQVYTRQALREIGEEKRGPALFRLMRSIFRSTLLDRIAREAANGRDEAEVRLAYRLRWAAELELPLPPRSMLYRADAQIAPGELDQALTRVRQEEARQGLLTFAGQCDFWTAYLRESFAERFKVLKDGYEADVLNAIDAHPDESPEQSSARIRQLEERFKSAEQALIEQLTLGQSLSSD